MSGIPYFIIIESIITAFVIVRLFLYLKQRQNIFTIAAFFIFSVFLFEKNLLLHLPYALRVLPIFFGGLLLTAVFDPELRRWGGLFRKKNSPSDRLLNQGIEEIVKACQILSQSKTGALFAIERNDALTPFIQKSVVIDAKIRHELLLTIFTPPTYLHDGGVILKGGRIVSCSAIFPLSNNPKIKKDLGTRHRAALGISEETDALCLVVSEETGAISIGDRGNLFYDLDPNDIKECLERLLKFKKIKTRDYLEASHAHH